VRGEKDGLAKKREKGNQGNAESRSPQRDGGVGANERCGGGNVKEKKSNKKSKKQKKKKARCKGRKKRKKLTAAKKRPGGKKSCFPPVKPRNRRSKKEQGKRKEGESNRLGQKGGSQARKAQKIGRRLREKKPKNPSGAWRKKVLLSTDTARRMQGESTKRSPTTEYHGQMQGLPGVKQKGLIYKLKGGGKRVQTLGASRNSEGETSRTQVNIQDHTWPGVGGKKKTPPAHKMHAEKCILPRCRTFIAPGNKKKGHVSR